MHLAGSFQKDKRSHDIGLDKLTGPQTRKLLDYAIHSISQGEDALGEVAVKVEEGKRRVTGRGLSVDIEIEGAT